MDKTDIYLTVIIPTKNAEETLAACLEGIERQSIYHKTQILVIDSGSTDSTLAIVGVHPKAKLYQIKPEEFNHGGTRNLGVKLASSDYVYFTVQDAVLACNDALEIMLNHFEDTTVAGVCGQQIVAHNLEYNPHEWFRPQSKPTVQEHQYASAQELENFSPAKISSICSWDDVNAMYRRSTLLAVPFREVMFGEDMIWARDALAAGYKIIYDRNSQVEHYHTLTYDYAYKRALTSIYFKYQFFKLDKFFKYAPKHFLKVIYRNFKYSANIKWIPYNWKAYKAYNQAVADFEKALDKGEDKLEAFYNQVCKTAPQAKAAKRKITV